jgi:anti-sigma factor (TIGR02949 family)
MSPAGCQEIFARLSEYLDGELPEDVRARIARHIEECAPCVEFVETLRKSKELCRGFEASEKPGTLDPAVRERMLAALRRNVRGG